jgi:hypothetical protein
LRQLKNVFPVGGGLYTILNPLKMGVSPLTEWTLTKELGVAPEKPKQIVEKVGVMVTTFASRLGK